MIISEEAKKQLKKIITDNGSNCIQVTVQRSCCGEGLMFELKNMDSKRIKVIDEIPFVMDFEASVMCQSKKIDVQNGELVIIDQ